jgi:hypothetical protein
MVLCAPQIKTKMNVAIVFMLLMYWAFKCCHPYTSITSLFFPT